MSVGTQAPLLQRCLAKQALPLALEEMYYFFILVFGG